MQLIKRSEIHTKKVEERQQIFPFDYNQKFHFRHFFLTETTKQPKVASTGLAKKSFSSSCYCRLYVAPAFNKAMIY